MAKKRECIEENCNKTITKGSKSGRCRSCANKVQWESPKYRKKITASREKSWRDGVYDNRKNPWEDNPELCTTRADIALGLWQDPEYVAKRTAAHQAAMQRPEVGAKISKSSLARWRDPEIRPRLLKVRRDVWKDEKFRSRHAEATKLACQNPEWKAAHTWHGSDHHNWRGGDQEYGPDFNDILKLQVRTRDDFRCQLCGELENGRAHDCHHINYCKQDNDEGNLTTLCQKCHRKTNVDREYWQAYFTGEGYELMLGAC